MAKKKYIGKVVSFKFNYVSGEEIYYGYVVDYNDDWTLLKYNAFNYVRDGYIILRNKHVLGIRRDKTERFHQKILDLKGESVTPADLMPIDNIETILNYLTKKYGVFQFDMRTDSSCWLGRVKEIHKNNLTIHYLDPKGVWTKTMDFKLGNIRTIQFETDYIQSLMLVAKSDKKKKKEKNKND